MADGRLNDTQKSCNYARSCINPTYYDSRTGRVSKSRRELRAILQYAILVPPPGATSMSRPTMVS
jgi:hypothetical protein